MFVQLLAGAGKTVLDVTRDPKSAEWKEAIAAEMKRTTHPVDRRSSSGLVLD